MCVLKCNSNTRYDSPQVIYYIEEIRMERTSVILHDNGIATWSFEDNSIMLVTDSVSAQWNPYSINIDILDQVNRVIVVMSPLDGTNYPNHQSWYFRKGQHSKLVAFFKSIGYPCH